MRPPDPTARPDDAPPAHSPDHDFAVLAESHLFDADWYLTAYPDVKTSGLDPLLHFVLHGAEEQRDPSEFFSTRFYLEANPDVADSPFNPLVHYALHGRLEGRRSLPTEQDASPPFAPYPYERLMRTGLASVMRQLAQDATPAEQLARPDPDLYSPTISIILPVFDTPTRFLREVVQSIHAQTYPRWQLCITDDCSTRAETLAVLKELSADPRVILRRTETNSGIAKASDLALSVATGDYVAFVDHDDLLTPNALSEVVGLLRSDQGLDYIYSDHLQADPDGLPYAWARKPSWSPEFLLSTNYIVHLKVVRRELLLSVGGLGQERSQVQDLGMSLRLVRAGARIAHLPKALYLWREHGGSVAASTTAKPGIEGLLADAISDHLENCGSTARACWPAPFRRDRVGAFHLDFPEEKRSVAAVRILQPGMPTANDASPESLGFPSGTELHSIVADGRAREGAASLGSDALIREFFRSLEAEYIVLVSSQSRLVSFEGLPHLLGYLSLSPDIGAAGGKVLNEHLRVIAGGLLMQRDGRFGLIGGGAFENDAGHWLIGQIPSNVDAVSQRCMAVRRSDLVDGPGLKLHGWGELAGTMLCHELRERGRRIVYDPEVKVFDRVPLQVSSISISSLRRRTAGLRETRRFIEFPEAEH